MCHRLLLVLNVGRGYVDEDNRKLRGIKLATNRPAVQWPFVVEFTYPPDFNPPLTAAQTAWLRKTKKGFAMIVFATPDFGAGAMALMVALCLGAVVLLALGFAVICTIALLAQQSRQQRKKGLWIGLCLVLGVSLTSGAWYFCYSKPHDNVQRLLNGDDQIELLSLTISGQQQTTQVSDPISMAYLNRAFRSAVREGHVPTHSYGSTNYGDLNFGVARTVQVALYVPYDVDGFTVAFPIDGFVGDPTHFWVALPEPMPMPVAEALKLMRAPSLRQRDRK
jgi:hypothetical protein